MAKNIVNTPLMKQYNRIKSKHPDAILLFRVGDFYETFGEDAVKTAKILDIVLTKRANGAAAYIDLAGFPHHALDTYLPKLVKAGHRVAICDQLEDPKLAKKIVKRGVTELVTPGVSYNDKVLDTRENNFLAGIHLNPKVSGVSFLDISTGEFYLAQGNIEYIDKLIQTFKPSEVLVQRSKRQQFETLFGNKFYINSFDDWVFTEDYGREALLKHFKTNSLKGFGVDSLTHGIIAAGAALYYLAETHHDKVNHICKISRIEEDHYVWLDRFTVRNLEMLSSPNENATTLIEVIDKTISPMGSRLLRRWLLLPLKEKKSISDRHQMVEFILKNVDFRDLLQEHIREVGDLERLISKVAVARISPREIQQLKRALVALKPVKEACMSASNQSLQSIGEQLNVCQLIMQKIEKELKPDPPALVAKGNVIADGVSEELDDLRKLAYEGKDYLAGIQKREVECTGIPSLKIGYNNVFGYYLEVTNAHKDKVPDEWTRKQTLVNSERYITEELKEYEEKILGAEEKIQILEARLYNELVLAIGEYTEPIQLNASLIARLDCLYSFALSAQENNYCKPEINDSYIIDIKEGRHPVIEKQLPLGESYIPNDVYLDPEKQQVIILTGPNMSGKSALLRQTALIVILAQIGSFVPATEAKIGLVDKVFTRVGASDNISSGESTFMVEMNETASILNNISNRSLILLDEIGRGTSTYDGISIAWAIAEFLHEHPLFKPKILFATHYHELNEMANSMKRIKNYHISIREINNQIIFLRKLEPGGSEHSFGIHVARMAGMPQTVIERANVLLKVLEESHSQSAVGSPQRSGSTVDTSHSARKTKKNEETAKLGGESYQLSFIQLDDPLLEQIRDEILNTDVDNLTPVEALNKLNEIKRLISG